MSSSRVLPIGGSGVVLLLVGVLFGRLISPYTEDVAQYVVEPVSFGEVGVPFPSLSSASSAATESHHLNQTPSRLPNVRPQKKLCEHSFGRRRGTLWQQM